ncbi:hypothetical protein GCM10010964_15650 [Caldovatus sediminis]|uniref:DUF2267 domain-containing protein n=1 Tax=Caldovatus sediminis TaxID=2041189 RepID=A0A8J3EBZ8_9PROT|nr:hypothetical protein GCM10010964_15650 [Caldovatus sediminis]
MRGAYYDQWRPAVQPARLRDLDRFLARVNEKLAGVRPLDARDATHAVLRVLCRHLDRGQVLKVLDALPQPIRAFWPLGAVPAGTGARGAKMSAAEARETEASRGKAGA